MDPKKIIIVGASSGIGRKMAELYAERGDHIGITGRRSNLLEEIKKAYPLQIEISTFDVTEKENIPKLEELVKHIGGLDLLIISAGIGQPKKELDWEIDQTTVQTNVDGFVEIANWGFNFFWKQGHGQLAAISSVAANRGGSHAPAYNASKAFQSKYLEGLALKAWKDREKRMHITVSCIEPGFVNTKMSKSDKIFWLVPLEKAARQIIKGLDHKRRKIFISRRWRLIAWVLKWMPHWIYRRIA
jgi:short-subunit dehydrogenase